MTDKNKLTKMLEERTTPPAKRDTVQPVNLYKGKPATQRARRADKPHVVKYTTHLKPETIKAIKRVAVETDREDYMVVLEAVEEYLAKQRGGTSA